MVDEEARELLEKLNGSLEDAQQPFKLGIVDISDFELIEKNARYMPNEMFKNLVSNIKKDGGLTSVPYCYKNSNGKYRVLSGNHRVMGAKEAGLQNVLVLYTDKPLSRKEQVAIQLSHNAIEGKDDPVILKALWEEIDDVGLKYYAGLDDKTLDKLEQTSLKALSEVDLSFKTLTFIFLESEVSRVDDVFKRAIEEAHGDFKRIARAQEFERLIDATAKAKSAYNIKNSAVALQLVLDIFEQHIEDLQNGWLNEEEDNARRSWVPLASIFGIDKIPSDVAKSIKNAVDKMVDRREVRSETKWQALEFLFKNYLSGE
jgi:ParB-like chromosome segregation protein Spo0J